MTKRRILCVGKELDFLLIRCEVLTKEGYDAQAMLVGDALNVLRGEVFDLIILSALLDDQERTALLTVIGDRMMTLELHGPTFPKELLGQVQERLTTIGLST